MFINLDRALVFLLVMMRMTGILVFNPFFGRRNIPTMVSAGLALLTSYLLLGSITAPSLGNPNFLYMALLIFRELFVGLVAGVLFQMLLSVLIVGGEIIDLQLGVSMSKAFDPATNTSISISSGFFNVMLVLIFFGTGNHLTFLKIMTYTFQLLPPGQIGLNLENFMYLPELFTVFLIFAMKLAMPSVVIEFMISMAVGIVMRIIPQINIFVMHIQLKLLVGLLVLVLLVGPFFAFFGNLVQISFEHLQDTLIAMFRLLSTTA